MLDCDRLIDPVVLGLVVGEPLVRLRAQRRGDVGHQNFGVNFLLDGVRQLTREAFQMQTLLERFEQVGDILPINIQSLKS